MLSVFYLEAGMHGKKGKNLASRVEVSKAYIVKHRPLVPEPEPEKSGEAEDVDVDVVTGEKSVC